MRISAAGEYVFCRWADHEHLPHNINVAQQSPLEFFQKEMEPIRKSMIADQVPRACSQCTIMEQHGKISGRQRQLLKVGIQPTNFAKTMKSSPFWSEFEKTHNNKKFELTPQDWQIELGNYCNSACVFCTPDSSSRLASEFKKLKIINQTPAKSWAENPVLLKKVIKDICDSPRTKYIHFIGGETVITPAFKTILEKLIQVGLNNTVTIGFTTNLTVMPEPVIDLISQFHSVNIGMSVECLTPVNDYVRWPSDIDTIKQNLDKWVELGKKNSWYLTLRVTPTALTIHEVLSVYDYAVAHCLNVESANFLYKPEYLKVTVLPQHIRQQIAEQFNSWIIKHSTTNQKILNIRHPELAVQAAVQDAKSYIDYLLSAPDESHLLPKLVDYLKLLETNRQNSILDYVPQYKNFLRTAGY